MDLIGTIKNIESLKDSDDGIRQLNITKIDIIDNIAKDSFLSEFILFASAILKYKIKLNKHPSESIVRKQLIENYLSIKDTEIKKHPIKLNYAMMTFTVEVLQGNFVRSKIDLLTRIINVNANSFVERNNHIEPFSKILKNIYPLEELIDILIDDAFKGKFWNNSILTKKSNFLWVFPNFWTLYGHEQQFKKLYKPWLEIFKKAIKKDDTELAFFMVLPMTHIYTNLSTTQEEYKIFNQEVNKPFAEYITNNITTKYSIKPCNIDHKKKKIGFVYDRIVGNSPTKLLYSFLEILTKKEPAFEYYVYDLEIVEKSPSDKKFIEMITSLGVKYCNIHNMISDFDYGVYYYSHFNKSMMLRNRITQDSIDILIMSNNWSFTTFLFSTRTAPEHIFWCHGAFEFDIYGIDKRITHIPEGQMQKNNIHFERFKLLQSEIFFDEEMDEFKKKADEIRKNFPKDAVILGSIGRLIKLEGDEYLEAVAKIMIKCPNTIYLACGTGGLETIKRKIKALGIEDRFYFTGWVNPKIYAHIIDVYLNTFPDPSGEAQVEYSKLNKDGYLISFHVDFNTYVNESIFCLTNKIVKDDNYFLSSRNNSRNQIYNLLGETLFIVSLDNINQNNQTILLKKLIEYDKIAVLKPSSSNAEIFYQGKSLQIELNGYESLISADFLVLTQWNKLILDKMIKYELCRVSLINDENMFKINLVKENHRDLYEKLKLYLADEVTSANLEDFYASLFDGYNSDFISDYYNFEKTNLNKLIFEIEHYIKNIYDFKIMTKAGKKLTDYYNKINKLSQANTDISNLKLGE